MNYLKIFLLSELINGEVKQKSCSCYFYIIFMLKIVFINYIIFL